MHFFYRKLVNLHQLQEGSRYASLAMWDRERKSPTSRKQSYHPQAVQHMREGALDAR